MIKVLWADRAATPGLVPFFGPEVLAAFVHSSNVGDKSCFGFCAKMPSGEMVFAEYHGCEALPRIMDHWRSWQPLTALAVKAHCDFIPWVRL